MELSLQKLREMIHAPLAPLDKAVGAVFPFEAQPAAPRDDTVLYQTKAGPITRGDLERGIEAGMGVSGGGLSTKGIKAYHSSPHDFDRFDLSKIGSGEGAQAYGHGIYAAESPAVSGQGGMYWNAFQDRFKGHEGVASEILKEAKFNRAKAIEKVQREMARVPGYGAPATGSIRDNYEQVLKLLQSDQPIGPRTYELNIKADPQHFLNWDLPLEANHPVVRAGVEKHLRAGSGEDRIWRTPGGEDINLSRMSPEERAVNERLVPKLGGKVMPAWQHDLTEGSGKSFYTGQTYRSYPEAVSRDLSEAGIPGIKYLDAGSRGRAAGSGTSNYVVFDPSTIDIMKKYGIAGMAAPATAYGAMRGDD